MEGIALWCLETLITEGINAAILQGEVTVLEGKNGCGKSTFLKAFSKLASGQEEYSAA